MGEHARHFGLRDVRAALVATKQDGDQGSNSAEQGESDSRDLGMSCDMLLGADFW
jgi:hypothetical protein